MTMNPLFILLTLVASGLGAYLGSYLKKKGENLATHDDINKLLAQVTATKEMEGKISVDAWERQTIWELKKDAILEVVKELAIAQDALRGLESEYEVGQLFDDPENARMWLKEKNVAADRLCEARLRVRKAKELARLACDGEVLDAFSGLHLSIGQMASDIAADRPRAYDETLSKLRSRINNLTAAIRKELGIPMKPE
jgi:hypothetical protein